MGLDCVPQRGILRLLAVLTLGPVHVTSFGNMVLGNVALDWVGQKPNARGSYKRKEKEMAQTQVM